MPFLSALLRYVCPFCVHFVNSISKPFDGALCETGGFGGVFCCFLQKKTPQFLAALIKANEEIKHKHKRGFYIGCLDCDHYKTAVFN